MKYIILCSVGVSVLLLIVVGLLLNKKYNNKDKNGDIELIRNNTNHNDKIEDKNKIFKQYSKPLNINMLNGSFYIHNNTLYCIGRLYEKSPITIVSVYPNSKFISKIDREDSILEDIKYLGDFDNYHYFIGVNSIEYFSIWKASNDKNHNYKIYQCIIKLDKNFEIVDLWNITKVDGLEIQSQEKNWKKLGNIDDYKIKFIYDQDNFTVIEGDLKSKKFKLLYSNSSINKNIINNIKTHKLKKKPFIRGGVPVIEKKCDMYFINHQQIIINNEIHYRLNLNIYDKEFNLKDNILFDNIFNKRVEYPTSAFMYEDNIYVSFGLDDKATVLYKIDIYNMSIKENVNIKNSKQKNLFIDINNNTLKIDN